MITTLPTSINTIEEAKAFLTELHKNGESYHPEDSAHDIINTETNKLVFTYDEALQLDRLMDEITAATEDGTFACEFLWKLESKIEGTIPHLVRQEQIREKEEEGKHYCHCCLKTITEGYVINGIDFYCSEGCIAEDGWDYEGLREENEDDNYWTEWEDEDEAERVGAEILAYLQQADEAMRYNSQDVAENKQPSTDYLETHFDVVEWITETKDFDGTLAYNHNHKWGKGGLYDLAKELTAEFQKLHRDTVWGDEADYYDTLEGFLNSKR